MKTRQVAAHFVNFNGKILPMHVVVICNGKVTECFPLKEEIAMTEWLSGTIEIRNMEDGAYQSAFWKGKLLK
ncbi:MAG: hypothetical protein IJ604_04800 [Prevotella sp.]|nr:hypothetical protein [Prevotella sp.]